ncbi:GumC family protein [Bosea sp. LjRoot9]|uniref:GumC family protein n=1 Tax=Bosea sp. LjRoot9 TaxID=3342341 RepID=UPI003ECC4D90
MVTALEVGGRHDAPSPTSAFGLPELLNLLKRRRLMVAASACVTLLLALAYVVAQTPVYRATAELLVDPQALQIVGKDIVRSDSSASIDFANVDSQSLVMTSSGVLRQMISDLDLEQDSAFAPQPGFLARHFGKLLMPTPQQRSAQTMDALRRAIVIQRIENSLVFRIIVSHPDATKSADIANALARAYFRQGNDGRRGAVERANESLISQIAGLRTQLNDAEAAVQAFRIKNNLVSTGETGLVVTQQLRDLYTQISQASAELARQTARRDGIANLRDNGLLSDTIPEALTSTSVVSLRTQYAQTAREAASLAQTLMPQHPRLIEIRAELAETRKLLAAELGRVRSSVQQAYRQAEANLANLQKRASELTRSQETSGVAEIRLRQLESEAEAIRAVYNASLTRARELDQQKKIETSNSRLLSEAVPPAVASKPPAIIVLAAALLFGACAGLGIAYLLELLPLRTARLLPQSALTPKQAGEILGVASVARLPKDVAERQAALAPTAKLLQARFGRHLPASVLIAGPLDAAVQADIAQHLAQALAEIGESVLIYRESAGRNDINMRRIDAGTGPSGSGSRRSNFVLVLRSDATDSTRAISPDAIVLAADLSGMGVPDIIRAASKVDPTGELVVALVTPGETERLFRRWPRAAA